MQRNTLRVRPEHRLIYLEIQRQRHGDADTSTVTNATKEISFRPGNRDIRTDKIEAQE